MSAQTKTERVLRDVLNSDNLRDLLSEDVFDNAMKWRFLQAALIVLDGHGLLGDPDAKKNATPAQLDPSKVKAGDMVRVLVVTIDSPVYEVSGEAYTLGHALAVGGHVLTGPGVTLTAHQPAPEPEPEWKPGTVGMAMVSGKANVRVMRVLPGVGVPVVRPWVSDHPIGGWLAHTDPEVADFVPDEPRPLPTRDELVKAMHDDYLRDGEPRLTVTAREHLADAVLTFLRGESR